MSLISIVIVMRSRAFSIAGDLPVIKYCTFSHALIKLQTSIRHLRANTAIAFRTRIRSGCLGFRQIA